MLNRGRWVVLLAAVLSAALTARLGIWQLDRAAQKTERQGRIEARDRAPLLTTDSLAVLGQHDPEVEFRRAMLQGRWLGRHTVFLDNRQMGGRPGFFVVTPLLLPDGSAVLVQRGWAPRNFQDRSAVPEVPTPDGGPVRLLVRVAPPPAKLLELGDAGSGRIRQNLDLEGYGREIGLPLRSWSAWQLDVARTDGDAPAVDGLRRDWPAPASDVSKHHGYAFQWFALSALIIGLYVWFQLIQPRRRAAKRS